MTNCRNEKLSEKWTVGISNYPNKEMSEQRTVGMKNCHDKKLSEKWTVGITNYPNKKMSEKELSEWRIVMIKNYRKNELSE